MEYCFSEMPFEVPLDLPFSIFEFNELEEIEKECQIEVDAIQKNQFNCSGDLARSYSKLMHKKLRKIEIIIKALERQKHYEDNDWLPDTNSTLLH